MTKAAEVILVIQVNGKLRDKVIVPADADQEILCALALARPKVMAALQDREPREVIVVPGRLVNIVI